jgi:hypothetical protein
MKKTYKAYYKGEGGVLEISEMTLAWLQNEKKYNRPFIIGTSTESLTDGSECVELNIPFVALALVADGCLNSLQRFIEKIAKKYHTDLPSAQQSLNKEDFVFRRFVIGNLSGNDMEKVALPILRKMGCCLKGSSNTKTC